MASCEVVRARARRESIEAAGSSRLDAYRAWKAAGEVMLVCVALAHWAEKANRTTNYPVSAGTRGYRDR
jgi:hypothetical protein